LTARFKQNCLWLQWNDSRGGLQSYIE
jgi:hypothetical protein